TPFGLTVAAEDTFGNVDTNFQGNATISTTSSLEGILGGTLTVAVTGGVASFSGLTLVKAGSGFTLKVSTTGLPLVTTSPFSVTPLQATQLVVSTQPPPGVTPGGAFGLTIAATDLYGNLATNFNGQVTVALASNPGGSALGGTTTVPALGGLAVFSGLTINTPGAGYTIQASS